MSSQMLNNFLKRMKKKERPVNKRLKNNSNLSKYLLDVYVEMINDKAVLFANSISEEDSNLESFDSLHYKYGTIESINEELGEVVRADRILKAMSISDEGWSQDSLLEELGDLIFNISLFASRRGIKLDDILDYNLEKVKKRG